MSPGHNVTVDIFSAPPSPHSVGSVPVKLESWRADFTYLQSSRSMVQAELVKEPLSVTREAEKCISKGVSLPPLTREGTKSLTEPGLNFRQLKLCDMNIFKVLNL